MSPEISGDIFCFGIVETYQCFFILQDTLTRLYHNFQFSTFNFQFI